MAPVLQEHATYPVAATASSRAALASTSVRRLAHSMPWAVCVVTAVAAALRFAHVENVSPNLFYDSAVRSMSTSWHNFFFGAFDPGGILSVDKPPLDLWLQV